MSKFTDCKGREWIVELTAATVRKVRRATERDLNKIQGSDKDLSELVWFDPMGVLDVLWVIVEEQATTKGVTAEQFDEGFDAATNEVAGIALFSAIVDFFRPRQMAKELKGLHPKMAAKMAESVKKAAEQALALDGPPSTTPSANGSAPAGSEPALPASTPGPSRFES